MKNILRKMNLLFFILVLLGISASDARAFTLPDPTDTFDGLPVAVQYDQFLSYSAKLLDTWGFEGFDDATGVGGLDLVIFTHAGGIDNDPVSGGFTFEDPVQSAAGGTSSFDGTWGAGDQPNGPVKVSNLLSYLQTRFGPAFTIPVFTFDMSETGRTSSQNLNLVAKVDIYDPTTATVLKTWSLDAITNSLFDPAAYITVHGEICVTGTSTTEYCVDNNIGSGKPDFMVVAPTMDLSLYADGDNEFHAFGDFINLNGAGEELFISGALPGKDDTPPTVIPEPTTMALYLLGVAGMFGSKKFRTKTKV